MPLSSEAILHCPPMPMSPSCAGTCLMSCAEYEQGVCMHCVRPCTHAVHVRPSAALLLVLVCAATHARKQRYQGIERPCKVTPESSDHAKLHGKGATMRSNMEEGDIVRITNAHQCRLMVAIAGDKLHRTPAGQNMKTNETAKLRQPMV
eukprot:362384-Chlamydomonas_euryale.AAC.3